MPMVLSRVKSKQAESCLEYLKAEQDDLNE
jgi:hypothetical protein